MSKASMYGGKQSSPCHDLLHKERAQYIHCLVRRALGTKSILEPGLGREVTAFFVVYPSVQTKDEKHHFTLEGTPSWEAQEYGFDEMHFMVLDFIDEAFSFSACWFW